MRLRVLAPTITDFALVPGAADRDPVAYSRFWQERRAGVDAAVGASLRRCVDGAPPAGPPDAPGFSVSIDHATFRGRFNRYQDIHRDTLERPLHVATARIGRPWLTAVDVAASPSGIDHDRDRSGDPESPSVTAGFLADLWSHVAEVTCRVFDHGIMLIEFEASDVGPDVPSGARDGGLAGRLDRLRGGAVALGAAVARWCDRTVLRPLHQVAVAADRRGDFVVGDRPLVGERSAAGNVLWVTRSLVVVRTDPALDPVARHWLEDAGPWELADEDGDVGGDGLDRLVRSLRAGRTRSVTRWLNYLFTAEAEDDPVLEAGGRLHEQWTAMRYAQYHYAALEQIGHHLGATLARSFGDDPLDEIRTLREELERTSGRARLVIIERHDVSKYLERSVRHEVDAILDHWDYSDALVGAVERKIEATDARLDELEAHRSARAQLFTDVLLQGLVVATILGAAIGLAQFGRARVSDPLSPVDAGRDDLIGWFAAQPADAIVLLSILVSVVLVLVYVYFRRFHGD